MINYKRGLESAADSLHNYSEKLFRKYNYALGRFGDFLFDNSGKIKVGIALFAGLAIVVGTAVYFSSKAEPAAVKTIQREPKPSPLEEDINLKELPVSP